MNTTTGHDDTTLNENDYAEDDCSAKTDIPINYLNLYIYKVIESVDKWHDRVKGKSLILLQRSEEKMYGGISFGIDDEYRMIEAIYSKVVQFPGDRLAIVFTAKGVIKEEEFYIDREKGTEERIVILGIDRCGRTTELSFPLFTEEELKDKMKRDDKIYQEGSVLPLSISSPPFLLVVLIGLFAGQLTIPLKQS